MRLQLTILTAVLAAVSAYAPLTDPFLTDTFADGFLWGTATAAYQIEGAWNISGKGENIWDKFTHMGGKVYNNDTGDVACDSYNKFKDDIELMKHLGISHYRFSISWSRIFPSGKKESYNQAGMDWYKTLVDELTKAGIKPMATLYHWDLPQPLQDEYDGWTGDAIIPHFVDYADKCFEQLGDKVKYWITFNEPFVTCWLGYGIGIHAPGWSSQPGLHPYQCAHNIIRAHAKAFHVYDGKYRASQQGQISITLDSDWKEPKTNDQADVDAAERAIQFKLGWFANPIFVNGDYPEIMKTKVAVKSTGTSRLPVFTDEEKVEIKGTHDFFGLNHYTTQLVEDVPLTGDTSYENDQDLRTSQDPEWKRAKSSWLYVVPWGLQKLLVFIKDNYNNPAIIITENGVSDDGELEDDKRIDFYESYINCVLKAVKKEGVNVFGYTAWSLLDNFEWALGYSEKFGIHYVDFEDPDRPRTAKKSAEFFKTLISNNGWKNSAGLPTISVLACLLSVLAFLYQLL